jgi:hypothetical protein
MVATHAHLRWKLLGEFLELLQIFSYLHLAILVQQNTQQSLRAARILYCLRGKEDVVCRIMVEATVFWCVGPRFACRVLEEEYDAVDLSEASEFVGVQGYELFELYVLNAEFLDEVREDALWICQLIWRESRKYTHTASLSIVFQPPDMVLARLDEMWKATVSCHGGGVWFAGAGFEVGPKCPLGRIPTARK